MRLQSLVTLLLLGLIAACGPAPVPTSTDDAPALPTATAPAAATVAAADNGYPAPTSPPTAAPGDPYPPLPPTAPPATEAYPSPENDNRVLFAFDRPISAGDTVITGQGPPGVAVFVRNLTFMGETIGSTAVNEDGTFSLTVQPLPANVRIGLTGNVEARGIAVEDIRPGPGEFSLPQVGYFFDTVLVNEP